MVTLSGSHRPWRRCGAFPNHQRGRNLLGDRAFPVQHSQQNFDRGRSEPDEILPNGCQGGDEKACAGDIVGLTVNRWPYGYAYTYDTLADPDVAPEERPHVVGRRRFGQVTIANADAGAAAFTNQAIDEAHRAVEELFVKNGLT